MTQQTIKIIIINKLLKLQNVRVLRSSLKYYNKISKKDKRVIWAKDQIVSLMKKKVKKARRPYTIKEDIIKYSKLPYAKYTFRTYRMELILSKVDVVITKLKSRYNKVANLRPELIRQRIGVKIGAKIPVLDYFTNKQTKRVKKREFTDGISTQSTRRDDPNTEFMFEELKEKLIEFLMKGEGYTIKSVTDEYIIKEFFVMFVAVEE